MRTLIGGLSHIPAVGVVKLFIPQVLALVTRKDVQSSPIITQVYIIRNITKNIDVDSVQKCYLLKNAIY